MPDQDPIKPPLPSSKRPPLPTSERPPLTTSKKKEEAYSNPFGQYYGQNGQSKYNPLSSSKEIRPLTEQERSSQGMAIKPSNEQAFPVTNKITSPFDTKSDVANSFSKEAADATMRLSDVLVNSDKHIESLMLADQYEKYNEERRMSQIDNAPMKMNFKALQVPKEAVEQRKQEILNNPEESFKLLQGMASHAPESSIGADLYKVQAAARINPEHDNGKIKNEVLPNIEKLKKREIVYRNGLLYEPQNVIDWFKTSWKNKEEAYEGYDFLHSSSDEEIAQQKEKELHSFNPDKPIPEPKGDAAEILGSFGSMPLFPAIASTASAAAATMVGAPEAAPIASKTVGAATGARAFYKLKYNSEFNRVYEELRMKGVEPLEAVKQSRELAEKAATADAVAGAAMGFIGGKAVAPIMNASVKKAAIDILKQAGKSATTTIGEGVGVGGLMAGSQYFANYEAAKKGIERDTNKETFDAFESGLAATVILKGITHDIPNIGKDLYKKFVGEAAKMPDAFINEKVGELVAMGQITPDGINKITEEIANERKGETSVQPKNLVQDAITEINKGEIKGYQKDIFEKKAKENPEEINGMLKEVADQAHDPLSAKVANDVYGGKLVSIAKELFPEVKKVEPEPIKTETDLFDHDISDKADQQVKINVGDRDVFAKAGEIQRRMKNRHSNLEELIKCLTL